MNAMSRYDRLNSNKRTLYHQTDEDAVRSIIRKGKLLRGSTGLLGGGIYFTDKPENTLAKTTHGGYILKCEVKLGNVKVFSRHDARSGVARHTTFHSLQGQGYDSAFTELSSGKEWTVYNYDQVKVLAIARIYSSGRTDRYFDFHDLRSSARTRRRLFGDDSDSDGLDGVTIGLMPGLGLVGVRARPVGFAPPGPVLVGARMGGAVLPGGLVVGGGGMPGRIAVALGGGMPMGGGIAIGGGIPMGGGIAIGGGIPVGPGFGFFM